MGSNDKKEIDLNLTMQQKFNFDGNNMDEIDISKNNKRNTYNKKEINIRMNDLIKIKNKYKRNSTTYFILFIIMTILFFSMTTIFLCDKNIKEKKNIAKKEEIVIDENIVFLGDSLTENYKVKETYKNYHVVNSGHGGYTTDNILDNMNELVYQYNPSKVFLLIGTNDLLYSDNDYIYNNIINIIDEIRKNKPYAKIFLESVYPINNSSNKKISRKSVIHRKNDDIDYINNKLKNKYESSDVTYIDVNKYMLDDNDLLNIDYTVDGVHLSTKGYKKVTEILKEYIKQ